jgi:hypothetical protein
MSRPLLAALALSLAACGEGPPPFVKAAAARLQPPPVPQLVQVEVDPNEALAIRVRRALEAAGTVEAAAIDIIAADGLISLWGTAGSKGELERAAELAAKVDGVKAVENRLVIIRGS